MKNHQLTIIAGPDGVDVNNCNAETLIKIAQLPEVDMVRCVGAKSRTAINSQTFCGIDYDLIKHNQNIIADGGSSANFVLTNIDGTPTSLDMAKETYLQTGKGFATELSGGIIQLLIIQEYIKRNPELIDMPVMIWNPAVDQLANNMDATARIVARNGWSLGIKNSHALGEMYSKAESSSYTGESSLEKRIKGMVEIALHNNVKDIIVLMRGVDIGEKTEQNMRNVETPYTAMRLGKYFENTPEVRLGIDHNHSMGGMQREGLLSKLKESAIIKINENKYLYDVLLVESVLSPESTSLCDGDQPLYYDELVELCNFIKENRNDAIHIRRHSELDPESPTIESLISIELSKAVSF